MSPRLLAALPRVIANESGLLRGRVHQSLWLEMVVATTAASALMALAAGGVVLRHEMNHLSNEAEEVQRQLSTSLTSYEPLHNLQRRLQQATSSQEVDMALVVDAQGQVLAASNNALVGLPIDRVLTLPNQTALRALFARCPSPRNPQRCLAREGRRFLGPIPWIGGESVVSLRQYPLALEGMARFGDRGSLITIGDAHTAGREALSLMLWVFLASLLPLMLGSAGLILRLRARLIPELLRLAQVDALSGVYNRRAFVETAEVLLGHAREASLPMALALIDIDHFKRINDDHGHEAGDRVIQRVSELLRGAVRGVDLVGRLGGDEFVILLQLTSEAATQAMERILEVVRSTRIPLDGDPSVQVTLSVGVAAFRGLGGDQLRELMASADAALYVAKDRGRNQVVNLELEAQRSKASTRRLGEWQIHGT